MFINILTNQTSQISTKINILLLTKNLIKVIMKEGIQKVQVQPQIKEADTIKRPQWEQDTLSSTKEEDG